jgi:hypothetical protein
MAVGESCWELLCIMLIGVAAQVPHLVTVKKASLTPSSQFCDAFCKTLIQLLSVANQTFEAFLNQPHCDGI